MEKIINKINNFLVKLRVSKNIIAVLLVIAFILSLVPLIITAFYSVPVFDDYNFGYYTYEALLNGHSFVNGVIESIIFWLR